MITNYLGLCNYFRGMKDTIPGLGMVTIGSDEEALDSQTAPMVRYPHLRVDTPTPRYSDAENLTVDFAYTLYVLAPENTGANGAEDKVLSDTELLLRRIYKRIWQDADLDMFDLVESPNQGDAIRAWSGDNCFGWTMAVTIRIYANEC